MIAINREQWALIPPLFDGIKPYYYISTYGRIYSTYTNTFIVPRYTDNGYLQASLMTETGRVFRKIHRLVMMTFAYIVGCEHLHVNHKDGNKCNNYILNLEWSTPKDNIDHAIKNGLRSDFKGENNPKNIINEMQAKQIGELLIQKYNDEEIMKMTNCPNKEIIRNIATGNTWSYLFTDDELSKMLSTRQGHRLSVGQKHQICKYFEDNKTKYNGYGKVIKLSKEALLNLGLDITDTNLRYTKRLYYKYDNPEIGNLYNY